MLNKEEIDKQFKDKNDEYVKYIKKCNEKNSFSKNKINMDDNYFILSEVYMNVIEKNETSSFKDLDKLNSYVFKYIYNNFNYGNGTVNRKSRVDNYTDYIDDELINTCAIECVYEGLTDEQLRQIQIIQKFRDSNYIYNKLFTMYYEEGVTRYRDISRRLQIVNPRLVKKHVDKMKFIIKNMLEFDSTNVPKFEKIFEKMYGS